MSRTFFTIFIAAFVLVSGLAACKKLPDGFLSTTLRYEEDPILINKGQLRVSSALNFDGSSKPAKIELVHIYNRTTGENVDALFAKKVPMKIWTGILDPKTDTTMEAIAAKQKEVMLAPLAINEVSGQLESNYGTLDLPSGGYTFDLRITNGAGSKVYPRIGNFDLVDAPAFETPSAPYLRMSKVGDEGTGVNLTSAADLDVKIEHLNLTDNKVILKFVDKNGVVFNPAAGEVAKRPNTGLNPVPPNLQNFEDYAFKTSIFNDRMEFVYVTIPFPLNSLGNGFNLYYRIPAQYFNYDDQAAYPKDAWNANPRFSFRAYVPGTYQVTFTMRRISHR
ncbi:DUF5007 domain-containing protein [Niabella aurantiaca]|uniref:DUF5007 domain-containing protein n=1 Tax=Niabella aurantiaca TaxID=379900 RepID=UPI000363D3C3|nr:DUF5007 domain-containing protein [Niabella aurantiaca]